MQLIFILPSGERLKGNMPDIPKVYVKINPNKGGKFQISLSDKDNFAECEAREKRREEQVEPQRDRQPGQPGQSDVYDTFGKLGGMFRTSPDIPRGGNK